MEFDNWQKEIIDYKGSLTLTSGRQVGKSTTVGKRRAKLMLEYPSSKSLIIAPAQRQSSELFIKTMSWLYLEHEKALQAAGGYQNDDKIGIRRNMELQRIFEATNGIFDGLPTKTMVKLKNGSVCYALPAGKTGIYLRTFALDFLDIDEAAYVPDTVYTALKPMLAVAANKGLGWETFLSTPFGRGGFFYDACLSDDYKHWHKSSEDCARIPRNFLRKERKRLSRIEYAQEYLGEFIDEFQQYFPTKLIKERMNFMKWNFEKDYNKGLRYYYGHDYAGPGVDENASVIAEMDGKGHLRIIELEEDEEPNTTKTNAKIAFRDSKFKFRKLFVDSGGFGCGPTDELTEMLGKRVVGLNNAKKSISKKEWVPGMKPGVDNEIKGKIFKEDLYSNAKSLMERGEVDIIDNLKLLRSLKSMTFEYTADRNLKIYGKCSHLAEAFVRVCWAVKEKGLNIYIY